MANSSWLNWCWYSGTWRTPVTLSPSCHWWGELQQQHPCLQTFITQNHLWHAQTPSHCLSIISALKIAGSDSLWLISGCVLLSLPSAYYGLVTWQYIFYFYFLESNQFQMQVSQCHHIGITLANVITLAISINVIDWHLQGTSPTWDWDLYNVSCWDDCGPHVKKSYWQWQIMNQWLEWLWSSLLSCHACMSLTMSFNCL